MLTNCTFTLSAIVDDCSSSSSTDPLISPPDEFNLYPLVLIRLFTSSSSLKLDRWLEMKIGIDIIKQEEKWFEKHPLLKERIEALEEDLDEVYKKVNSK